MTTSILFAIFGGLAINVLDLLELQNVPIAGRPNFKDILYWLPFIVWPALGGILAFAYTSAGATLSPILAINVGASAPLILRAMASTNPLASKTIDPGPGA
jgi:hypothetical protein